MSAGPFREAWEYSDVVPWQPWAKKRPRISRGGGRTHQDPTDKEAEKKLREYFAQTVIESQLPLLTSNVAVRLVFYRRTAQVVDIDNLVKHFMDCANGVLWVDDCQVTKFSAELHLDRDNPRTEWRIGLHSYATLIRDRPTKLASTDFNRAAVDLSE